MSKGSSAVLPHAGGLSDAAKWRRHHCVQHGTVCSLTSCRRAGRTSRMRCCKVAQTSMCCKGTKQFMASCRRTYEQVSSAVLPHAGGLRKEGDSVKV